MGNTETVAFTLPAPENTPEIVDTAGRTWRYLHYEPGSVGAKWADQTGHGGSACYWYWDNTERQIRFLADAGKNLPCLHSDGKPDPDGMIFGDGVWYVNENRATYKVSVRAKAVSHVPLNISPTLGDATFDIREIAQALPALGHGTVEVKPLRREQEEIINLGRTISRYWDTLHSHQRDTERLQRPMNSSRYRERIETINETRRDWEELGYDIETLDAGATDDANGRFGKRYIDSDTRSWRIYNETRLYNIGRWALESARADQVRRTVPVAAAVNQEAVSELLDW